LLQNEEVPAVLLQQRSIGKDQTALLHFLQLHQTSVIWLLHPFAARDKGLCAATSAL
jgi:hypothetical protein